MNRTKLVLSAGILLAATFLSSCGEIDANFCGEARSEYSASNEFCSDEGEVYPRCDGKIYNTLDSFCYKNVLYEKCGGEPVDLSVSFCYNNELYAKCNGKIFNPVDSSCNNMGYLESNSNRCPPDSSYGQKYNPLVKFCYYDNDSQTHELYDLCNGIIYDPKIQFCGEYENLVYAKCKNSVGKYDTYNTLNMECLGGRLYGICDRINYGPCAYEHNLRCKNRNKAEPVKPNYGMKCDSTTGKIFGEVDHNGFVYETVQIGEQVWMARDLNNRYDWASAMGLPQRECNDNEYHTVECGTTITGNPIFCERPRYPECEEITEFSERRGLCPDGWRIPNNDEWQKLVDYAGGDSRAGKELKSARSGGTDNYGFGAELSAANEDVWWWSSEASESPTERSKAYAYVISTNDRIEKETKERGAYGFSVRCLRNN
jgi:uncharacterized protein (TIGR02145 family)